MKTTFLLTDETAHAKLLLQNAAPRERREMEMFAGCNCDRWGHPFTNCIERNVQGNAELPSSTGTKQARPSNAVHQQARN
jgi:hypothetical protein